MSINAKKISFLGLLLAFTVILVILGSIIETNTLFLLAAASFCVGISIRESGMKVGFAFYLASVLLSFFIAPNKFHCITFMAMGFYVVITEFTYDQLTKLKSNKSRKAIYWLIKYITFNVMYIPILLFFPKLFYQGEISLELLAGFFLAGQIVLFIYDIAYRYFQQFIWGKLRGKLLH